MLAVYTRGGNFMGRVLDVGRLLSQLLPQLAARVRSARLPFQGRLTFRTEEGEASIVITADDVLVDGDANGEGLLVELPQTALARLCLGGFDPGDVLARLPNRPDREVEAVLRVLSRSGCRTSTRWTDFERDLFLLPSRLPRVAFATFACILRFQPRRDRGQQTRLLVVARQFPEHDAAQTLGEDVVGLAADRLGIVVAEHRATGGVVEPGHLGFRVAESLVRRQVVRRDRVVVGTDRAGERLIEAIVVRGNAGEPAPVERDADDELVARHPLIEERVDGADDAAEALPFGIARVAARFGKRGVEVA